MSDVRPHRGADPDPRLAAAPWLTAPETQRVIEAVAAGGGEVRVVGGAIRNTLLAHPVTDVDLATTVLPEEVVVRAANAGLTAIPTGIDHGTVTIVAGHKPFEVTTLRRDVSTDGRRATVAFTGDWESDARRRDFTINALYCDAAGRLFDYTGGLDDLANHRVRFIGAPQERISEDYLRILRFYRFTACYAGGSIDREGHEACAAMQDGLANISSERIRTEIFKLLIAPHAPIVLSEMDEAGLLTRVLGGPADVLSFARLCQIEALNGMAPDPLRRLYVLAVLRPADAVRLRDALRLSRAEFERLDDLILPDRAFDPGAGVDRAKCFIYRHGAIAFRDGTLVSWARDVNAAPVSPPHAALVSLASTWRPPCLPVSGKDVLALGVPPGPEIGQILDTLDDWWMLTGFTEDETVIRARLAALVNLKKT